MARPFRSFRVEAVVLKHREQGEADRMLTAFSRERGKLQIIAKGVRKVKSRKAGHVEPFTRVSLQLSEGRTWYVLSQAEAQDTHNTLREDLSLVGYASYIVELLDKFTIEDEEHSALYRLLTRTLTRLETEADLQLVVRYYEMRLLDLLGFRPELQNCVVTEKKIIAENQYFSAALGGVISPEAGKGVGGAVPVSMNALRFMRHMQRSSYERAAQAEISADIHREMEILMQHYLTYLLERGLNSPSFLRRVRQDENE